MIKYIKKNLSFLVFGICALMGAIFYPELSIEMSGGFAWFYLFVMCLIAIEVCTEGSRKK